MKFKSGDKVLVVFEAKVSDPDADYDDWKPGCICNFHKKEKMRVDQRYLENIVRAGGDVIRLKKKSK